MTIVTIPILFCVTRVFNCAGHYRLSNRHPVDG